MVSCREGPGGCAFGTAELCSMEWGDILRHGGSLGGLSEIDSSKVTTRSTAAEDVGER